MFYELLEKNILQENGSNMLSKLFGDKTNEKGDNGIKGIKVELRGPADATLNTELTKLSKNTNNSSEDHEDYDDFEQSDFADMSNIFNGLTPNKPICLKNTRLLLNKFGITIPPSQASQNSSAFSSWGVSNGNHPHLTKEEIAQSESYYRKYSNPSFLFYTNSVHNSGNVKENNTIALDNIKKIFSDNPNLKYANVLLDGISDRGLGHSIGLIKSDGNKDGESSIGLVDEVANIDNGKNKHMFDMDTYFNRASNRSKKQIAVLGVAFYEGQNQSAIA